MMSRNRRFHLTGLVVVTAGGALASLVTMTRPPLHPGTLCLWALACLVGEAFWVPVGGGQGTISMALAIDLAALCTLGAAGGLEVVGLSTVLAGILLHRRVWYRALFNASQSILAGGATLWTLEVLRNHRLLDVLPTGLWWPALFAGGFAFFVVNSGFVSWAISLAGSETPWRVWRLHFGNPTEILSNVAQIALAGFLLATYQRFGNLTFLALLPLIAILRRDCARQIAERTSPAAEESHETAPFRRAG